MQLSENKVLGEVSEHYRLAYLLRRFFATLLEVDSALIQLNAHATFKRELQKFPANQLRDWTVAINFFAEKKAVIKARRNAYGAHLHAKLQNTSLACWTTPKNRSACSRSSSVTTTRTTTSSSSPRRSSMPACSTTAVNRNGESSWQRA